MDDENLNKDLERIGMFSVPTEDSGRERAGLATKAERVLIRVGKIGLALAVVVTFSLALEAREEVEDLNRQVNLLWKTTYSPDRSWVARELVFKGGTALLPGPAIPTGKFLCGKAGAVPKECTPAPYVARTTELCVFPWTAEGWPKTVRPFGTKPEEFGTPRLCPESILHPEK